VDELIREIEARLPPTEDDSDQQRLLASFYALLVLTREQGPIRAREIHDAWACAMAASGREHPSLIPYRELDAATRQKDEPFAEALSRARDAFRARMMEGGVR
jgi:hypothetical protein